MPTASRSSHSASVRVPPLQIIVTNTFDAASLSITKHAINAPSSAAAYTVTVTCTVTGLDGTSVSVPLVAGSSPLTIRSGETVTITALAEAVCTVAEPNPGGAHASRSPRRGAPTATPRRAVTSTATAASS